MKTNKKTTAKKTATRKAEPKYTLLDCEDIGEIIAQAETLFADADTYADVCANFEVEEYEEAAGTFFIQYDAKTWRDAAAFNAAMIAQAFELGYYAEPSAKWEDELDNENGRRYVSVFVAAADYMTDDGHAVA